MDEDELLHSYDLGKIIRILFKHKWTILGMLITTISAAVILSFLLKRQYEAKTKILIRLGPKDMQIPSSATGDRAWVSISLQKEKLNSEVEILTSHDLALRVAYKLGQDFFDFTIKEPKTIYDTVQNFFKKKKKKKPKFKDLAESIQGNLKVEVVAKSYVINAYYRCQDPQKAIKILEVILSSYKKIRNEVLSNREEHNFFTEQKQIALIELGNVHNKIKALKEETGIFDIKQQRSLLIRKLTETEYEIAQDEANILGTKSRLNFLVKKNKTTKRMIEWNLKTDRNPIYINLEGRLAKIQLNYTESLNQYLASSPFAKSVLAKITTVRKQLQQTKSRVRTAEDYRLNADKAYLTKEILVANALIEQLKEKIIALEKIRIYYQKRLQLIDTTEKTMDGLYLKLGMWQKVYQDYHTRWEKTRISQVTTTGNMAIIQHPALVSSRPVKPKIKIILLLSIILGVCMGGFLTLLFEYLDHTYKHRDDVARLLELEVLAVIPQDEILELIFEETSNKSIIT